MIDVVASFHHALVSAEKVNKSYHIKQILQVRFFFIDIMILLFFYPLAGMIDSSWFLAVWPSIH